MQAFLYQLRVIRVFEKVQAKHIKKHHLKMRTLQNIIKILVFMQLAISNGQSQLVSRKQSCFKFQISLTSK